MIMNAFFRAPQWLALAVLAFAGVSCKNKTTVADNPYGSGGAYFPPAGGSSSESANVTPAQDYVAPPSAPASSGATYGSTSTYGGGGGGRATGGSRSHTVVKGDTLYGLSRRYGTSVSAIQGANGLTSDNIRIGQTLSIP